jgi:hypothetical protein
MVFSAVLTAVGIVMIERPIPRDVVILTIVLSCENHDGKDHSYCSGFKLKSKFIDYIKWKNSRRNDSFF